MECTCSYCQSQLAQRMRDRIAAARVMFGETVPPERLGDYINFITGSNV